MGPLSGMIHVLSTGVGICTRSVVLVVTSTDAVSRLAVSVYESAVVGYRSLVLVAVSAVPIPSHELTLVTHSLQTFTMFFMCSCEFGRLSVN